eukprot:gene15374-biopygen23185
MQSEPVRSEQHRTMRRRLSLTAQSAQGCAWPALGSPPGLPCLALHPVLVGARACVASAICHVCWCSSDLRVATCLACEASYLAC